MRISDWSSDVCSSDLARADLAAFTHYNLSFANPDAEGRFVKEGRMTCMEGETGANLTVAALRGTVARLQAGGGKVLISTAGGVIPGCSGDWKALLAPERRAETVAALVEQSGQTSSRGRGW